MNNDQQSTNTGNERPSLVVGMTSVPGRGRSVGRYKSNRENMFKKRKNNSDSTNIPVSGKTIRVKTCSFCNVAGHQSGYKCTRINQWNGTLVTKSKHRFGVFRSQARQNHHNFTLVIAPIMNEIFFNTGYRAGPTVGRLFLRLNVLNRNPTFFFPDLFTC